MGKLKAQLHLLRQQQSQRRPPSQPQKQQQHKKSSNANKSPGESETALVSRKPTYKANQRILLVGEANFSFTRALLRQFKCDPAVDQSSVELDNNNNSSDFDEYKFLDSPPMMLATTLDSQQMTEEKYPDVKEIVAELETAGIPVLFQVDATDLQTTLLRRYFRPSSADTTKTGLSSHPLWSSACRTGNCPAFDVIVFNFPHCGRGITDQDRNIRANQELLLGFMQSASRLLASGSNGGIGGQLHITLKQGEPYDSWKVKALARRVGLQCMQSFAFYPHLYDGYAHRRTLGFQPGLSRAGNEELAGKPLRTFVFSLPSSTFGGSGGGKRKRSKANNDSDSE